MAGFCSQCGRPLADGEVCTCTQQAAQNQQFNAAGQQNYQQYNQGMPQGAYQQQADPNAQQQFNANGQQGYQQFDANGQPIYQQQYDANGQPINNGQPGYGAPVQPQQPSQAAILFKQFGQDLLASLKNPIQAAKEISATEKKSFGLLSLAINGIVILLVELIVLMRLQSTINSALGSYSYSSYYSVSLPTGQVIFSSLIALAAVFFAQTGILLGATKMLGKGATEGFGHMLTVTGEKAFYDSMVLLASGIFFMISAVLGALVFAIGNTFVSFIYMASYYETVKVEGYRKVLVLLITEVGKMIVSAIIAVVAFSSVISTLMNYASYLF